MKNRLLLRDFRLFDPSEKLDKISDILIEDGKITKIDEFIDISNVEIIQGNKQILLPGLIDFHVHYRDPGETYKEEIFGPVLSIIPFETEDEAVKIVNDTSYGLGNYLQTEDREKAHRVAKKLRSGCVYIIGNGADAGTPFGGYRQSGNGREGGVWGLEEYLEVKNVTGWS